MRLILTNGKKATRPCPCGYHGDSAGRCRCTPEQVRRYRSRLSGPLLDRIDLQIEVPALPAEALQQPADGEASAVVRSRVVLARETQIRRQGKANARLETREIDHWCAPEAAAAALLKHAISRFDLSARAYHRLLKVARSIADLSGSSAVAAQHVAEAVQYRRITRD
ncbi:ATP-binding protein [Accumulibacter sp.]|uniref:magnesium chelatase subunit ChlI family protein n=1 Tax=Accumulibacter sp. TaxID=2053492 RepID=UPI0035AFC289